MKLSFRQFFEEEDQKQGFYKTMGPEFINRKYVDDGKSPRPTRGPDLVDKAMIGNPSVEAGWLDLGDGKPRSGQSFRGVKYNYDNNGKITSVTLTPTAIPSSRTIRKLGKGADAGWVDLDPKALQKKPITIPYEDWIQMNDKPYAQAGAAGPAGMVAPGELPGGGMPTMGI